MYGELDKGNAPVFPEVGSMTTLCPGISLPSRSAISTIRVAILSFTEPPGETYSNFPTEVSLGCGRAWRAIISKLTEIALKTFMLRNPVEADKGRVSNCVKNRSKNCWHAAENVDGRRVKR
jgi:hypothetical protein